MKSWNSSLGLDAHTQASLLLYANDKLPIFNLLKLFPKPQFKNPTLRAIHPSESPCETTLDDLNNASDWKVVTKKETKWNIFLSLHHKDTPRRAYSLKSGKIKWVVTPLTANVKRYPLISPPEDKWDHIFNPSKKNFRDHMPSHSKKAFKTYSTNIPLIKALAN